MLDTVPKRAFSMKRLLSLRAAWRHVQFCTDVMSGRNTVTDVICMYYPGRCERALVTVHSCGSPDWARACQPISIAISITILLFS